MKNTLQPYRLLSAALAAFFVSAGSAMAGGDEPMGDAGLGIPLPGGWQPGTELPNGVGQAPNAGMLAPQLTASEQSTEGDEEATTGDATGTPQMPADNTSQVLPPLPAPLNAPEAQPVASGGGIGTTLYNLVTLNWWGGSANNNNNNNNSSSTSADQAPAVDVSLPPANDNSQPTTDSDPAIVINEVAPQTEDADLVNQPETAPEIVITPAAIIPSNEDASNNSNANSNPDNKESASGNHQEQIVIQETIVQNEPSSGGWGWFGRLLGFGGATPAPVVSTNASTQSDIADSDRKNEKEKVEEMGDDQQSPSNVDSETPQDAHDDVAAFLDDSNYLVELFPTNNETLGNHIAIVDGHLRAYLKTVLEAAAKERTPLSQEEALKALTRSMTFGSPHLTELNTAIYKMMRAIEKEGEVVYQKAHELATFVFNFILMKDSEGVVRNREAQGFGDMFRSAFSVNAAEEIAPNTQQQLPPWESTLDEIMASLDDTSQAANQFVSDRNQEEREEEAPLWDFGQNNTTSANLDATEAKADEATAPRVTGPLNNPEFLRQLNARYNERMGAELGEGVLGIEPAPITLAGIINSGEDSSKPAVQNNTNASNIQKPVQLNRKERRAIALQKKKELKRELARKNKQVIRR